MKVPFPYENPNEGILYHIPVRDGKIALIKSIYLYLSLHTLKLKSYILDKLHSTFRGNTEEDYQNTEVSGSLTPVKLSG